MFEVTLPEDRIPDIPAVLEAAAQFQEAMRDRLFCACQARPRFRKRPPTLCTPPNTLKRFPSSLSTAALATPQALAPPWRSDTSYPEDYLSAWCAGQVDGHSPPSPRLLPGLPMQVLRSSSCARCLYYAGATRRSRISKTSSGLSRRYLCGASSHNHVTLTALLLASTHAAINCYDRVRRGSDNDQSSVAAAIDLSCPAHNAFAGGRRRHDGLTKLAGVTS